MAPKKAAVAVADSVSTEAPHDEEKEEKKADAATVHKLSKHPATAIMVREAIKALDSRKGVSSQAIQRYIKQKYPSVDLLRLKGLVRRSLKKGIENGTLVRPANATETTGTAGRFKIAKAKEPKEKSKEPKAKSENVDPNMQKAPKAKKETKGDAKKKKPAVNKEPEEDVKSSEDPKPAKKSKKDEAVSSKVAPAKKTKGAKKETEETEQTEPVKGKGKAKVKAVKEAKEKPAQKGKAVQRKAPAVKSDVAPTKARGKRGKNASE
ncbi:linker histone H1M [Eucyclogobius newberryi]|uniref:linker histone H1M n=1 Tax=Eucyclogobius newberryi TaxID=166745 RepID=UPI003B5AD4DD